MSGGYDLYGNWYARSIDAENAETAQCAAIDTDRLAREQQGLRDQQQADQYYAEMRMRQLEQRVFECEQVIAYLLGAAAESPEAKPGQVKEGVVDSGK